MLTLSRSVGFGFLIVILLLVPLPVHATIMYDISFNDPGGAFSAFYDPIRSTTLVAGADWARSFSGDAGLEVQVQFSDTILRSTGHSVTNFPVGTDNGRTVVQEGAAFQIARGADLNPTRTDIILAFNPTYLRDQLWFDPDPASRTTPVPPNKTDATTVITHELGHAFGFNGFRDLVTGEPRFSSFESAYDSHIVFRNGIPFFTGVLAEGAYGGPVPLTFDQRLTQNINHLGNVPPLPGSDLTGDLMNGIVFNNGTRYFISGLDLAILGDTGVPLATPEPGTLLLFLPGAAVLAGAAWRRHRTRPPELLS